MNIRRKSLLLLICFAILNPRVAALAQGSLTPSGAPAPTFKTLSEVEPRYPIFTFQTNLTVPGSYYLTTNIFSGTNQNDAITIRTNMSNITIDLNGFCLISTNPANGSSSPAGVRISEATNIVIRNGQIWGFDRGVRAEGLFYGVVVENLHVHNTRRAGLEADGTGNASQTVTFRDCVVESVDASGEGTSVAADGIVVLNCTGVVRNCVVRDIVAVGTSVSSCINASNPTNTFIDNCFLSNAGYGIKVTGTATRVFYRNNLASGCTNAFFGGTDRGGNF